MHVCTDEDFGNFYPIQKGQAAYVNSLKEQGNWFCFDWSTLNIDINGSWKTDPNYQAIFPRLISCASEITAFDGSTLGGYDGCITDEKVVKDWLGATIDLIVLTNQPSFK